jgi:hypothetical protein
MQKNASLKYRQFKIYASAGTRTKSMHGFGSTGCKVTVAEFTAQRSWSSLKSSVLVFGLVIRKCSRMTDKVGGFHILRVCQNVFEFPPVPCEEQSTVSGWWGWVLALVPSQLGSQFWPDLEGYLHLIHLESWREAQEPHEACLWGDRAVIPLLVQPWGLESWPQVLLTLRLPYYLN